MFVLLSEYQKDVMFVLLLDYHNIGDIYVYYYQSSKIEMMSIQLLKYRNRYDVCTIIVVQKQK